MEKEMNRINQPSVMKCNCCGKISFNPGNICGWYHFSISQNNQIEEDLKYYDVCSMDCYLEQVMILVKELEDCNGGEIDGMNIILAKKIVSFLNN